MIRWIALVLASVLVLAGGCSQDRLDPSEEVAVKLFPAPRDTNPDALETAIAILAAGLLRKTGTRIILEARGAG